jgi:hypothetical protein
MVGNFVTFTGLMKQWHILKSIHNKEFESFLAPEKRIWQCNLGMEIVAKQLNYPKRYMYIIQYQAMLLYNSNKRKCLKIYCQYISAVLKTERTDSVYYVNDNLNFYLAQRKIKLIHESV